MRIHTNLRSVDFIDALRAAGIASGAYVARLTEHGSRSRARAFDISLRGNSRRRPNGGTTGAADDYAATWDQWGVFLNVLFDRDAWLTIPRIYTDRAEFRFLTGDRYTAEFDALRDGHRDHKWTYSGRITGLPRGNFIVQECTCGATRKFPAHETGVNESV